MVPSRRAEATSAPAIAAEPRSFRPARDWTIGQRHRVRVAACAMVGSDGYLACQGLDDPSAWFEVLSARAFEEGTVGVVTCAAALWRVGPRWSFAPGEAPAPLDPPPAAPAGPVVFRARVEATGRAYRDQVATAERHQAGRRESGRWVGFGMLENALAWLITRGCDPGDARELVSRAGDDRADAWIESGREGGDR